MKDKMTPLMRQYSQIKKQYPETVLLFRMGDFFETFDDDAVITSKVCGIVLTKRHNGAAGESPLAGFPFHQLDAYLPKLVRAGYRVAVCEQLEDPKQARGIVRRGVVEVVTPGIALYDKLLQSNKNNYAASLYLTSDKNRGLYVSIACADVSTGEFFVTECDLEILSETLVNLNPAELLIAKNQKHEFDDAVSSLPEKPVVTKLEEWIFELTFGRVALLRHFNTQSLKGFGIDNLPGAIVAAGALLLYIGETQNGTLQHLASLSVLNQSEFMSLDFSTRRNLEINYSFSDKSDSSLISVIDKTTTPMGARLLKKWINRPLLKLNPIQQRLNAVEVFFGNEKLRISTRSLLNGISDLERLVTKISTGRATPRDVVALKNSLTTLPDLKTAISDINCQELIIYSDRIIPMPELIDSIEMALLDEPATQPGNGGVFKAGYMAELDDLHKAKHNSKTWLAEFQERERNDSGIPSLKVGYNNVFGYYIEITHVHAKKAPQHYERKQTLTNAERYTTPELKLFETKILTAEEKISEIEKDLFSKLLTHVTQYTKQIQDNASIIAQLDCLQGFAQLAAENNYSKPDVDESELLEIIDGRHPVVEKLLPIGESYTPNSTMLDTFGEQIHIITGPNMSGKSCYLRQTGLIVLLAQIGCFVPAVRAKIGIVDRIFTRVGAQDNISAGESTFLVEMQEAANIMNNATSRSLILLDEVGRGTATYDGISIAWSIAEYLHNRIRAKTLFATHYHELNDLAERYERIVNYRVEVVDAGSAVIFSHKVSKGASDHSFGIYVAKMAGLPKEIVERAGVILKSLESGSDDISKSKGQTHSIETITKESMPEQLSIFEVRDDPLRDKLLGLKIDGITPVEALKILDEMRREAMKSRKKR